MAIVHEAFAVANGSSNSAACNKPTDTASGDVLVCLLTIAAGTVSSAPSGWVEVDTESNTIRTYVYYLVAGGSEPSSYTWSLGITTTWAVGISRFSGVDNTTPEDVAESVATGSDDSAECATITTATNGAMGLVLVGANRSTLSYTPPSGYTEAWESTGNRSCTLAYKTYSTAGATGEQVVSMSNSQAWIGYQWALRPASGGDTTLTVAEASHAHAADAPTLTQAHTLVVDDAGHAHGSDPVALTQVHVLAADDAAHGHTADNVALTQLHILIVAEATHDHAADNAVLTQAHTLAVADATHSHATDGVVLTQVHVLVVADATHGHAADGVTLDVSVTLVVADAGHGHAADAPTLTQVHVLAVAEAAHSHTADNVTLTQGHILVVADATHAHTTDGVVLSLPGVVKRVMVRRASGAPWTPALIPNLVLSLDARSGGIYTDAGITPATDGQSVQQWNDASGQSHHASQATLSRRPTYRATGFNGQPALQFYDNELSTSAFADSSYNQSVTLFWIGRRVDRGCQVSVASTAFSATHTNQYVGFWNNNLGQPIYYAFGAQAIANDTLCVGVSYDGATLRTIVNGHLRTMPRTGSLAISGAVRLGQYTGNAAESGCFLAGAMVWRFGCDDTQMRNMCTYWLDQWGLSAPSPRQIVLYMGDSMTKELNYTAYPSMLAASIGNTAASHNAKSYPGGSLSYIGEQAVYWDSVYLDSLQSLRVHCIWAGSNTLEGEYGTPAERAQTVYNQTAAYCAARRAAGWDKVVVFTVLPRYSGGYEARRTAFNTLLRANWENIADALCDVAADGRIGDEGDNLDTTYYLADHVHINDAGHAVVAEWLEPIIEAMI